MHCQIITFILPRREGEFAVTARLLYPFIALPMVSYEKWVGSLFRMVNNRNYPTTFRLMFDDNGELFLNEHFAGYFAQLVASDVVGAIALILINEGVEAAGAGDPEFTNRKLDDYRSFATNKGLISAELLHRFLEVRMGLDEWLYDLKQRHGMRYGNDYVRVCRNARGKTVKHRRDNGRGRVIFDHRFASKVAASEPTRIGSLMRLCMMNFCRNQ